MVDLYVGPAKTRFHVHKAILCSKIPYFDKMFKSGGFIEASKNTAIFSEDGPQFFHILIEWVYSGSLGSMNSSDPAVNTNLLSTIAFYRLLDKLCLPQLMDITMDMFRRHQWENRFVMRVSDILLSYQRLPEGSPYRRYALHSFLFAFYMQREPERDIWTTTLMKDAVVENADLAQDFFTLLRDQVNVRAPINPDVVDNCLFHCHKLDEECPLRGKKEA